MSRPHPSPASRDPLDQLRRAYDERPYPRPGSHRAWRLAPMEWIDAVWRPGRDHAPPRRILIAGCGTGAEAFAVRRRFPDASIVAVDFSSRSIAVAKRLQERRPGQRPIRFLVADLAAAGLARRVGRAFDFVSCHGVLTYLPEPARVLAELSACMAADGALHLGVNGSRHRSVPLRAALTALGLDTTRHEDSPHVREALALCDSVLPRWDRSSAVSTPCLESDVFGPFFQNLPLADWIGIAHEAGLHFGGSFSSYADLRRVAGKGLCGVLLPRSRAEVCALLDLLQPAAFHQLLFTRRAADNPPWHDPDRLAGWRPVLSRVFRTRLPATPDSKPRAVVFTSSATNTRIDCEMAPWQVELLRRSDGTISIGDFVSRAADHAGWDTLVQQLYMLHQLAVVNLLPPARVGRRTAGRRSG